MNPTLLILIIVILIALLLITGSFKQKQSSVEQVEPRIKTSIRPFIPGNKAYVLDCVECRSIPSNGGEKIYLNKGAKGKIIKYSREGTYNDVSDDFIGFKIVSGDEAIGKTVWIPTKECKKLEKRYA